MTEGLFQRCVRIKEAIDELNSLVDLHELLRAEMENIEEDYPCLNDPSYRSNWGKKE